MAQLNANTPYIDCLLRKEIIEYSHDVPGFIFGCKSMINRPLLFHFQSNFGANFWNLPISAFCHTVPYDKLSEVEQDRLSLLETWDCQSNYIATTSFKFLQFKKVDVICRDKIWRTGHYLFTIDDYEDEPNIINVGYSNDQDSKCFHFIKLDDGNFCIQPNNLLRWHNPDHIIPYDKQNPPKIKLNNERMTSEDIDRTFGNSPYFFYSIEEESAKARPKASSVPRRNKRRP